MEDGHPPVRRSLPIATLRARTRERGLCDLLRHPLPGRRAPGGPAAQDRADVLASAGARRTVRREVRLGAPELVRVERGRRIRATPTSRMGRRALVDGDPGRAHGNARARGAVRRVELREDRGVRPRRVRVLAAHLRERRRPHARPRGLHPDAELPRRHRVRRHRDAPGARAIPPCDRYGIREPRPRLDTKAGAHARATSCRARRPTTCRTRASPTWRPARSWWATCRAWRSV